MIYNARCDISSSLAKWVCQCLHKGTHNTPYLGKKKLSNNKKMRLMKDCCVITVNSGTWASRMSLERGNLPFASFSPTESWLRQQSSISPDPQKIHSNKIQILSAGHCLCRGPGASLCQVCPSCSCRGFVPHTFQIPSSGQFPPGSWGDAVQQDTASQAQQAQGCFGWGLPCPQSSKAVFCTAGRAFHHLQLFN